MNVRINLGGLSDAERASGIRGRAEAIEKEARLREEEIASELEPRA
jgi:formiminotetrahydrofolate cyclodeaminase